MTSNSFNSSIVYTSATGREGIRRMSSGDYNNDGKTDLVFGDGSKIIILLNTDGGFSEVNRIEFNSSFDLTREIVAGDFNRDGQADVAVSGWGSNNEIETILLGHDIKPVARQRITVGGSSDLIASDLNNDGYKELIVGGSTAILKNTAGEFSLQQKLAGTVKNPALGTESFHSSLMSPESVISLDVNRDGILDIVTASSSSDFNRVPYRLQISYGRNDSTYTEYSTVEIQHKGITNIGITDIISGDFNNDGLADIVTLNGNLYTGTFFAGSPTETSHKFIQFNQASWISGSPSEYRNNVQLKEGIDFKLPDSPWNAVVGDFNIDGYLDFAYTDYRLGAGGVYIMAGNGRGSFENIAKYSVGSRPEGIVSADFNGDGIPDIATANAARWDGNNGGEFVQPTVSVILSQTVANASTYSIADAQGYEGDAISTLVTRTGNTDAAQNIKLSWSNGTAFQGFDFIPPSASIRFEAGETSKQVTVQTKEDTLVERDEWFGLTISSTDQGIEFSDADAVITILNDDESAPIINNIVNNYYDVTNTTNNNNTWNTFNIDNSIKIEKLVVQWFERPGAAPQVTVPQENKVLDIKASSWSDKVLLKSVGQAAESGGLLEATQIDFLPTDRQGSVLNGGAGRDVVMAKAGWDVIDGGDNNDYIRAGNGRDIITGGLGNDELWGDFGWNTYTSEKDGYRDLIAIKSDEYLVNWLNGKAGNNPNGEKADIIEGLDSNDVIKILGVSTEDLSFSNATAHGVSGIGIYGRGALEAVYTGGDLSIDQIRAMTSGDLTFAGGGYGWTG